MRTELSVVRSPGGREPGGSSAFAAFFRAQFPVAARIAYSILRDTQLAEDVAQDALIAAERRFGDGTDAAHAAAWVRVAASHLALNAARDRRRREEKLRRAGPGHPPNGPEDEALAREADSEVRRALARLPRRSATVLVLRHSGLSYGEVAAAMGVKVTQIGTMLRRAEVALRKEVERGTRH